MNISKHLCFLLFVSAIASCLGCDLVKKSESVQPAEDQSAVSSTPPTTSMKPYKDESFNQIYDLLFCDDFSRFRGSDASANGHPWSVLFPASEKGVLEDSDIKALTQITEDEDLESRPRILAANLLRGKGHQIPPKKLFGVIIEVGMQEGLDTLAAYRDGSARYINYSEKLIVWETTTAESDRLISNLFRSSQNVVDKIRPWEDKRCEPPTKGNVRMTFLVSDGLYFGEAAFAALQSDEIGGPVLNDAALLMNYLIQQSSKEEQ